MGARPVALAMAGAGSLHAGDEAFALRPGVVVDLHAGLVYLAAPGGGVEAVSIGLGQVVWSSEDGDLPLALQAGRLVVLSEVEEPETVAIVELDGAGGGLRATSSIALPGVRTTIDDGLGHSFQVVPIRSGSGEVKLGWQHRSVVVRGAPAAPGQGESVTAGTLRFDLASSELAALVEPPPARLFRAPRPDLAAADRLPELADLQFAAVDRRHVMTSERIAPEPTWETYRWTVYSYPGGERIGEASIERSQAPFFVSGSVLVYEVRPSLRRSADGDLVDRPVHLRAVDLATGNELWTRPLRDTEYRGPFPP